MESSIGEWFTIEDGVHILYMFITFSTIGKDMPKDKWVVSYTQAESKTHPGKYEGFTCSAEWKIDLTEAEDYYIYNYHGDLPWSEGGRSFTPMDVMEVIPEQMGNLNPDDLFTSGTTAKIYEPTTRKNRGREKMTGWTGSQKCAARTIWWADIATREE